MKSATVIYWGAVLLLLLLWIIGMVADLTFGGLLHVLLAPVIAAVLFDLVRDLRA